MTDVTPAVEPAGPAYPEGRKPPDAEPTEKGAP